MREIKFRAWVKTMDSMCRVKEISFDENKVYLENQFGDRFWYGLIDVELMQYTGLHDKNGKEIYEGDIVSLFGGTKYFQEVFWLDEDCCFKVRDTTLDLSISLRVELESQIEVIGNIYETNLDELINKEKKDEKY